MIVQNNNGRSVEKLSIVRINEAKTNDGRKVANITGIHSVYDKETKKMEDQYIDISAFDTVLENGTEIKNATRILDQGVKAGDPLFIVMKLADKQGEGNRKYVGYSSVAPFHSEKYGTFAPKGFLVIDGNADDKKSVVTGQIIGIRDTTYKFDEDGNKVLGEDGNPIEVPLMSKSRNPKLNISLSAGKDQYFSVDIINTKNNSNAIENAKKVLKVGDLAYFTCGTPRRSERKQNTVYFTAFSFQKYGEIKEKEDGTKYPFYYPTSKKEKNEEDTASEVQASEDDGFIAVDETADIPFFAETQGSPAATSEADDEDFLDA